MKQTTAKAATARQMAQKRQSPKVSMVSFPCAVGGPVDKKFVGALVSGPASDLPRDPRLL